MEMLLSGQLSERPVLALIQEICQQDGSYILRLRSTRNEIGTLTFAEGELQRADCGDLSGEAAIATMLDWQTGTFSLSPRLTPTLPEAVARVNLSDEGTRPRTPSLSCKANESQETDRETEYFLISLLSKLERYQTTLKSDAINREFYIFSHTLAAMIDETTSFINQRQRRRGKTLSLRKVVEWIGTRHEAAYYFVESQQTLNMRKLVADLKKREAGTRERRQLERQTLRAMLALQTFLFGLILDLFAAEALRQRWQETLQLMLNDLSDMLES